MNPSDPRVKRTRKLIEQAFFELLAEKSFHQISVQDIAERATVNRATFYAHFEDKYELFDQMVHEWFQERLGNRLEASSPFCLDNLRLLILTALEALADVRDHCKPQKELEPVMEARVQQEVRTFILGWLQHLPTAGGAANLETTATVLSWAIFGAGLEWSRAKARVPAEQMAGEILTLISGSLSITADTTADTTARAVASQPIAAPAR